MVTCDFCKKEFSTKGNLISHQKTAKYCLEIQGKTVEDFKYNYCNKNFTSVQNLNDHFVICKHKKIKDAENDINKKYTNKYKTQISQLNSAISERDKTIEKLEKKLESYEKRIFEMASRPTNNNSNNKTVVINTNVPLTNEVLRQCANTFSIDYAKNIDGISRHFTESLEDHITCNLDYVYTSRILTKPLC